jgi:hypothetical protein
MEKDRDLANGWSNDVTLFEGGVQTIMRSDGLTFVESPSPMVAEIALALSKALVPW